MRTGSEMVRGLKENLQAKQAKQKKKRKKKRKKKKKKKISKPSKSSTPWGRKLCGEDCRIRFDAGQHAMIEDSAI